MNTIEKISKLLKEQGKKQKELTDYLGISQNAFTDWKSGRINSYTKHLSKIAEFLSVSVDYLLDNGEKENGSSDNDAPYEDIIIYHRNGKTVTRRFTKQQLDMIIAMIEAVPKDE